MSDPLERALSTQTKRGKGVTTSGGGTCAVRVVKYKVARPSGHRCVAGARRVRFFPFVFPRVLLALRLAAFALAVLSRPCVCVFSWLENKPLMSELWHWKKTQISQSLPHS